MSDDLFDCFGSDDECESQIREESNNKPLLGKTSSPRDEESCGVLTFHANTEQSLLMHVKNATPSGNILPCQHVLNEIDWYCSSRHWMMNVGPEKGAIVQNSLQRAIENKIEKGRFVAAELGTYCGYGSIFLSSILKTNEEQYRNIDFNLFTIEINPEYAAVARQMIEIAELNDKITVLENDLFMDGSTGNIGDLIKNSLVEKFGNNGVGMCIDFLMIDHDKDSYLSDMKRLEASGLIQCGTVVAADNVVFAGINEYIDYMKGLAKEKTVKTCTIEASVEYSSADHKFKDGIEITEYLKAPSILTK